MRNNGESPYYFGLLYCVDADCHFTINKYFKQPCQNVSTHHHFFMINSLASRSLHCGFVVKMYFMAWKKESSGPAQLCIVVLCCVSCLWVLVWNSAR